MTREEPAPPPSSIAVAVATAALTTLATALATWAVDELRARYGKAPRTEDPHQPKEPRP